MAAALLAAVLAAGSMVPAQAQPAAAPAGLVDLMRLARDGDPAFAAARQAHLAGQEKAVQGRALMYPAITLTANARDIEEATAGRVAKNNYNTSNVTVQATQPLWRPQNMAQLRQGELQAKLADQQLRQAEQELLLRTARAYFEVLQAQEALAAMDAQRQAFAGQLAQVKRAFEVGTAPVTDLNEAQARFDLGVAQQLAAANELDVRRQALQRIVGTDLPPLAGLPAGLKMPVPGLPVMAEQVERARQQGLAVQQALTTQSIAEFERERQRAGHQPTVDIVGGWSDNRNAGTPGALVRNDSRQLWVGVELALPLYQGGAVDSRSREAAALLERARHEIEAARRQAVFDARQAMLNASAGASLVAALEQAQSSAETQLRSSRRGLEVGVRSRIDVLNAEQQVYTTRRDLAGARVQTLVALLQLEAAAGELDEQDLIAMDALLRR